MKLIENNNGNKRVLDEYVPVSDTVSAVVGTATNTSGQSAQPEIGTFEYRKSIVDDYIRKSDQLLIGIVPRPKDKVRRKIYDHHRPILHLTTMVYTNTELPEEQKVGMINTIYEEYQTMNNNDFITLIAPKELSEVETKLDGLERRTNRDHLLLRWIALYIKNQIRLFQKGHRGLSN